MPGSETPNFRRLERALGLWRERCADAAREPLEQFLARNEDLREVLEPLVAGEGQSAAARLVAPAAPATTIAGYRIEHELGRGGMGVVYAATRLTDGRRAAVKVLPPARSLSNTATTRFRREASILQRLEHPGIVRVFDIAEAGEQLHFAMELIDGAPLDRVIARLRVRPAATLGAADLHQAIAAELGEAPVVASASAPDYTSAVVDLIAAVADALEHAHRQGVVHRDVKPANILVRANGRPVLTDFGIAHADELPTITRTGDFAGTPYYVSPEQAMASRVAVDHRTDVFSLGVTLYELLTLRRPFDGKTTQEVLGRILAKEPLDPVRVQPGLPPALSAIVFRALEKDPDARYPSAAACAADLRALLARGSVVARRLPSPLRALRWARRRPLQASLLAATALLLGAIGTLVVQAPAIAAANERERAARLEDLLDRAFLEVTERGGRAGLAIAEQALALAEASEEALYAVCLTLTQLGRPEEALARLQQAATVPATRGQLLLRSWLLQQTGRTAEAAQVQADAGLPATPLEHFLAGSIHLVAAERGDAGRLRPAFDQLLAAVLTDPAPRRLHHALLAHIAGHLHERTVAPRVATALQQLWPRSAHAWFWSGFAFGALDVPAAISAYRKTVELDPEFELAWENLGSNLEQAGQDAEGEQCLRRAIALQPASRVAHYNLGVVLDKTGRFEEAAAAFERALALDPSYAEAHCNLACIMLRNGNLVDASAHFEAALAAREDYPEAHLNFANALRSRNQPLEAIAHLQRAIELRPEYAKAHVLLAMVLQEEGEEQAAFEHWSKCIALAPKVVGIHQLLMDALRKAQRWPALAQESLRWAEQDPREPARWQEMLAVLAEPEFVATTLEFGRVLAFVRSASAELSPEAAEVSTLAALLRAYASPSAIEAATAGLPTPGPGFAAVLAASRTRGNHGGR
ncbi:MAG TPA: serine/threonine-protein kinase [Planctomycetota bacterium]|nr:serine/threonine-protein kinase [Planctomycetota bacterium]